MRKTAACSILHVLPRCILFLVCFHVSDLYAQHVDSVIVYASKDNTIYERNTGNSNGAGEYFIAGTTGSPYFNRALLKFDLAGLLPTHSVVTSVKLRLYLAATSGNSAPYLIEMHKVLQDWGEGGSNAGTQAGQGAPASGNDATWIHSFHTSTTWLQAGGNFATVVTAQQWVNQPGFYYWTSDTLRTEIQQWLSDPSTNYGWLLKSNENASFQAKRFASRENMLLVNRPQLTVYYTLIQNAPPSITIQSPSNNSSIPAGKTIVLNAVANDADGNIARVNFYDQGALFLSDSVAPFGLTNNAVEPGTYKITATAFDNLGDSTVSDTVRVIVTGCTSTGQLLAEGYGNIPGTQVIDMLGHQTYPDSSSLQTYLSHFEYFNAGSAYGGRLRGYVCAPATGDYIFYISADDQAGLFLSTDDNPVNAQLVAYNLNPVGFRSWLSYASQKSRPIRMLKGARYYIESLHKQSTGSDHLSVRWVLPNGTIETPVPLSRISPFINTGTLSLNRFRFSNPVQPIKSETLTSVFPNPSPHTFMVRINDPAQNISLVLRDMSGRIIEQFENSKNSELIIVGETIQSAGVFILQAIQNERTQRVKLIRL